MLNNLRRKRLQERDDFIFIDKADSGFQWVGELVSYLDNHATLGNQRCGQKPVYRSFSKAKSPKAYQNHVNGVWFDMIYCPKGSFLHCKKFDVPNPEFEIKQIYTPFLLGETEVTQELYQAVMDRNPSVLNDLQRPVENVSVYDAIRFCNKLSKLQGFEEYYKDGGYKKGYRLATLDEWEYAAKAGTQNQWSGTNDTRKLSEYTWNSDNSNSTPQPVAQLKPNKWGFYDMTGNVMEWCDRGSNLSFWGKEPCVGGNATYMPHPFYMMRIGESLWTDPKEKSKLRGFRIARSFIE